MPCFSSDDSLQVPLVDLLIAIFGSRLETCIILAIIENISGFSGGAFVMAAPAYIAEIAETKWVKARLKEFLIDRFSTDQLVFKVSRGFGHLHAIDGHPGHLLCQPELRNRLAALLRNLHRLPGSARALDVLDAKVANLPRVQGRPQGSQEVTPVLSGEKQRCDG